jgi:hypothetical protein
MMDESRLERLAPLTGLIFVVLLITGTVLINNYDFLPTGEELKSFYEDNSFIVWGGHYLVMLSAVFFIWFTGSLRSVLRTAEGGTGRLSAVAFGGGVAVGIVLFIAHGAGMAAASRGGADSGIPVETAIALFDFSGVLMGSVLPMGYAVLLGATAVISFRTGLFARWLSWVTGVLAVLLLIPEINVFLGGIALLWVLVMSIVLYRSGTTATPEAESA